MPATVTEVVNLDSSGRTELSVSAQQQARGQFQVIAHVVG